MPQKLRTFTTPITRAHYDRLRRGDAWLFVAVHPRPAKIAINIVNKSHQDVSPIPDDWAEAEVHAFVVPDAQGRP